MCSIRPPEAGVRTEGILAVVGKRTLGPKPGGRPATGLVQPTWFHTSRRLNQSVPTAPVARQNAPHHREKWPRSRQL